MPPHTYTQQAQTYLNAVKNTACQDVLQEVSSAVFLAPHSTSLPPLNVQQQPTQHLLSGCMHVHAAFAASPPPPSHTLTHTHMHACTHNKSHTLIHNTTHTITLRASLTCVGDLCSNTPFRERCMLTAACMAVLRFKEQMQM